MLKAQLTRLLALLQGYYGLAPGKHATLRYAYPIKCTGFETNADGTVKEITAEFEPEGSVRTKGVLPDRCGARE